MLGRLVVDVRDARSVGEVQIPLRRERHLLPQGTLGLAAEASVRRRDHPVEPSVHARDRDDARASARAPVVDLMERLGPAFRSAENPRWAGWGSRVTTLTTRSRFPV